MNAANSVERTQTVDRTYSQRRRHRAAEEHPLLLIWSLNLLYLFTYFPQPNSYILHSAELLEDGACL